MELLHAFYTDMTYVVVPQVGCTIITILYLWHENVYHYDRDGIIQINRVTIILLK